MHKGKYSELAKTLALEALNSDFHPETGQPWVAQFEEDFARVAGFKYGIAVNSGTSAIHAALLALGVGPGDEVISPALTVVMDAFATLYVGATPVFADVNSETWNLDPKNVESLINPKTKAIISVSWFGLPSDSTQLQAISKKYQIPIIDDSAETISFRGYEPIGVSQPTFRVFSFESKKHFSTGGEGGMLVVNDPDLAKKARQSAGLGYKHLSAGKGRTSLASRIFQNPGYARFDSIGFNYRMTPVTAAIGIGQLSELDMFLSSRLNAASKFLNAIKGVPWLIPQKADQDGVPNSYYTFGLRYLGQEVLGRKWEDFYDIFTSRGGHGFYSNCMNPYLEPFFRGQTMGNQTFSPGLAPVAELLQGQIMAFKTNYKDALIVDEQAKILGDVVQEFGK